MLWNLIRSTFWFTLPASVKLSSIREKKGHCNSPKPSVANLTGSSDFIKVIYAWFGTHWMSTSDIVWFPHQLKSLSHRFSSWFTLNKCIIYVKEQKIIQWNWIWLNIFIQQFVAWQSPPNNVLIHEMAAINIKLLVSLNKMNKKCAPTIQRSGWIEKPIYTMAKVFNIVWKSVINAHWTCLHSSIYDNIHNVFYSLALARFTVRGSYDCIATSGMLRTEEWRKLFPPVERRGKCDIFQAMVSAKIEHEWNDAIECLTEKCLSSAGCEWERERKTLITFYCSSTLKKWIAR